MYLKYLNNKNVRFRFNCGINIITHAIFHENQNNSYAAHSLVIWCPY